MQNCRKIKYVSPTETEKIVQLLNKCEFKDELKLKFNFKIEDILNIIKKDKKNVSDAVKMSLPIRIGKSKYNVEVSPEVIVDCVKSVLV